MLTIYGLTSLILAIVSLILGIYVYSKNIRNTLNISWFLLSLCIAVWAFGLYKEVTASTLNDAFFWTKVFYAGAIFIPPTFLFFVFAFLNLHKTKIRTIVFFLVLSFIFFLFNFSKLFIKDLVEKYSFQYWNVPGPVFPFFIVFFLGCILYAHFLLIKEYKHAQGPKKNQLKYFLSASAIAFSGGATNFPLIFGVNLYPFGHFFILSYPLIISYTIVQHRLMDIDIVIKKSVTYSLLTLLLLAPCLGLAMLAQFLIFGSINFLFTFMIFVLFGVATFIFPMLKPGAEETIEQVLFKGKYDYRKALRALSRAMISILDKETLLTKIITTTTEAMGVDKASIVLFDEGKNLYCLQSSIGLGKVREESFRLFNKEPLVTLLREKGKIIIKEELENNRKEKELQIIAARLSSMESEVCIPLITSHKLIGICNLGKKTKGTMFSHEDIELLETLGNQAAIAIENAQLYEDLKKSEAQIRRADRLSALGTLTAGLAHEIRNPLVAIKTLTQLLPERLDDIEFREDFLKVASGEVERICSLVNELLDFARPSEPNLQEVAVKDIAEKMLLLVESEAKKKNITLKRRYNANLPKIMGDKEQLKQVLLNLFLNAIDATLENGTITFTTRLTHSLKSISSNGMNKKNSRDFVQMEIRDTGEGISQDDLEHIFTPFFSTKHHGSGLGLSISYRIVQEHSGIIEVESKEGFGTAFFVNLPLNPAKEEPSKSRDPSIVQRRERM